MPQDNEARAAARQLIEAIERVRQDVARVELWAYAMQGFAQPVPGYELEDLSVWRSRKQATMLGDSDTS